MIEIDLRDLSRLEIQAERLRTPDTSELIGDLARKSLEQTRRRFRRRETPDGNPWPPRVDNEPHPLLEKSGRLLRSIQPRALQDDEFSLGTAGVPYAATHQYGYAERNIPARQFLGFGANDLLEIEETTDTWLARYVGTVLG